jgi:hypothetical protein
VPFAFTEQKPPGFFTKMVLQWCEKLSPLHGYAGIYLALSAEQGAAMGAEPLVYPLVKRFPGIEFDFPITVKLKFKNGIKGVNWLTVLSDKFVSELGGIDTLKNGLDDTCVAVHLLSWRSCDSGWTLSAAWRSGAGHSIKGLPKSIQSSKTGAG